MKLELYPEMFHYLTYQETLDKAKELGNGWRLPTVYEAQNDLPVYGQIWWTSGIDNDTGWPICVCFENHKQPDHPEREYSVQFVREIKE